MAMTKEQALALARARRMRAQSEQVATPPATSEDPMLNYNPAEDMSFGEQVAAGAGQSVVKTGRGIRQLWNRATGDDEELARLQKEEADLREIDDRLSSTAGGITGNIAGGVAQTLVPGAGIAKVAGAGASLPKLMALEGLLGGAFGATTPTVQGESVAGNAAGEAALGAMIPGAGAALRGVVGKTDDTLAAAADYLKRLGIDTPGNQIRPSAVSSTIESMTAKAPITSGMIARKHAGREADITRELFKEIGEEVPTNNQGLADVAESVYDTIKQSVGKKPIPLGGMVDDVAKVKKRYNKILPGQRLGDVNRLIKQMDTLSKSGGKLKTDAYQMMRADLGEQASTATGAHAKALRDLQGALDNAFFDSVGGRSSEVGKKVVAARENYRIAKALGKQDMAKGFDVYKAAREVEKMAKKGAVKPEVRDLLHSATVSAPKVKAAPSSLYSLATVASGGGLLPAFLGLHGLKQGMDSAAGQIPARFANDPVVRNMLAGALRGGNQTLNAQREN